MAAVVDLHPFRAGTLSVSESTRAVLRSAGTAGSDADFSAFTEAILSALAYSGAKAAGDLRDNAFISALPAKGDAFDAFLAQLLDYARCNTPPNAVAHALEEYGFKGSRAKLVADRLTFFVDAIRQQLTKSGEALPRLMDLKWRLDYLVSSSAAGKVGEPLYLIDLHLVTATGAPFTQQFTCTPQELEDLRARVKDALRAAAALVPAA